MTHPRHANPTTPEVLDGPDVGFLAGFGAYVTTLLAFLALTVGAALEASGATVAGSLTTAVTVGVVAGAVFADRVDGLAIRLGSQLRVRTMLFVTPVAFAGAALAATTTTVIPANVVFPGTAGAIVTLGVSIGV